MRGVYLWKRKSTSSKRTVNVTIIMGEVRGFFEVDISEVDPDLREVLKGIDLNFRCGMDLVEYQNRVIRQYCMTHRLPVFVMEGFSIPFIRDEYTRIYHSWSTVQRHHFIRFFSFFLELVKYLSTLEVD